MGIRRKKRDQTNSPGYQVRRRLMRNIPAMVGLTIIIIAHTLLLLGYSIMPDNTPNANDSVREIALKEPGFNALLIKRLKAEDSVVTRGFLDRLLFGQPTKFESSAVLDYKIDSVNVTISYVAYSDTAIFGGKNLRWETEPLVKLMRDVSFGNHQISDGQVTFLDRDSVSHTENSMDLITEFNTNHIELREYLLGTDTRGRDMLSRLLFGIRISLTIGFISVLISLFIGITLGALAGFFGGTVDALIMWLMTVVWSIPAIMLVIAISMALNSKGVWVAFVAVGLTMWVEVARVVRGQIISIREKQFVEAARALGIPSKRIIFKHILPNIAGPLIVIGTANFAAAIIIEAGLSFLNLGVEPPMPSWGTMVYDGYHNFRHTGSNWLLVYPSLFISVLVLAFNLVGNGLRDAYDPKSISKK